MDFLYKASPLGELTDYDEKNSVVKGYGSYFNNKEWGDLTDFEGNANALRVLTHHFKGNFPSHCSVQAVYIKKASPTNIVKNSKKWKYLLNKTKLSANKTHKFKIRLMKNSKINYIKINIYPDGGISRIKLTGKVI